jgi:hypothetical protein
MGIVNKINQAFLNKIPKMFWYNPFVAQQRQQLQTAIAIFTGRNILDQQYS